jgi:hypothetical protein
MKKIRNSETFTWLTVFSLVFSLVAGILVCDQANAQTRRVSTVATKAAKDSHSLLPNADDQRSRRARAFVPVRGTTGRSGGRFACWQVMRRNVMLLDPMPGGQLQMAQGVALRIAQGKVPPRCMWAFSANLAAYRRGQRRRRSRHSPAVSY